MRQLTLLTFLVVGLMSGLYCQSWMRYDADVLPSETSGTSLDLTNLSQDSPGDNFVEELIDDVDIPGNMILRYLQPDAERSGGGGGANKMYRFYFRDAGGNDHNGTQFTLVARLKGVDNWAELGLDRVFDLQLRNGASGTRDELRLSYDGNVIELDRSDASISSDIDFTDWHIFRMVVDGDNYTVYVDENNTPVLTGTSTATTSDRYLKIGDGSGDKVGGLLDWVALDTTGAYSPSQSPLDESFTGAGDSSGAFDPSNYSILFLTRDVTPDNTLEEQGIIDDLRSRGFNVDVTYNNAGSISVPVDVEFSYETANTYDLIIIGRGVSSGDFQDIAGWAAVETPIIHFSAYIMRSNRLDLINSTTATREVQDATTISMDRVANVSISDHPIFTGVDTDGDGEIGYHTWFHDYIGSGADTFEMNHNATLMASWATGDGPSNGNVAIAMWDGGADAYPGSQASLAGKRVYFQMGADDNSSPKLRNYTAFTSESTLVFHNLIKMLLGAEPDGQLIPVAGKETLGKIAFITKDVDESGNLEEIEIIGELRKRGYQVDVSYNDPGDITVPADFEFSFEALNDYDVVILGRGVSSGDFTEAEAWAAVEAPIIVFSGYLVRNNRMKLVNTSSATREANDGTTVDMDRITNAAIVDHPVFTGLDEEMDGEIGYLTWFYDYIGYGADTFELNHNATLLATLSAGGGPGDGTVYMAHWASGAEPYPGAGFNLTGPRLFMQMGSDDNSSPKIRNYTAFTNESLIALFNALAYLQGETPTGVLPAPGPVAQWSFEEGEGTRVGDAIGGANGDIQNGNGITWESCGVGTSLNFGGSTKDDAIIFVNDNPNLDFDSTRSFTISLLAKIDPYANTGEMNLLLKGDNRNDGTHLPNGTGKWYAVATKDSELRFALDDDVTKTQLGVAIDENNFPANQWNHIAAVRDRAQDSIFLYINGVKAGSLLDETDLDISTTGLPMVIGNYHSGVRKVNGNLDEIAIYDFAFTAAEVADLYASVELDTDCEPVSTIVELSNDATLSALEVSTGTLDPAFDPNTTSYSVELPEGTTSVTITATPTDANASVSGDGEFTNIPGSTIVRVTAEDGETTRDYSLGFIIEGQGNSRTIVEPGFENLFNAIQSAVSGDTLVLKNGEIYTPLESYIINKKIVIIAETIPSLPGLDNMPIIENLFGVTPVFDLQNGGVLTLIGVDVDGQGATNLFDTDPAVGARISVYINRCRLHNTLDDLFDDAPDGGTTETRLENCVVRNSFIYDSESGHGIYIKNYFGEGNFVFENNTYWNMGEQFNWIRHYPTGITQGFLYDHNTGYNLSTDLADNKELFGNSDAPNVESALDIDVKNNIFHTQLSSNEGSLKFNNTSGAHSIDIINNVLFNVAPIFDIGGTINKEGNLIDVDPMFADPDNGDFTVMNSDLYTAADDGEIIGALYWHPDFVDDFSDLTTSTNEQNIAAIQLQMMPNPFREEVTIDFKLDNTAQVQLEIFNIYGQRIGRVINTRLPSGAHKQVVNTNLLKPGIYVFILQAEGKAAAKKMVKVH